MLSSYTILTLWLQRRESNPYSLGYEPSALPLSYAAILEARAGLVREAFPQELPAITAFAEQCLTDLATQPRKS